MPASAIEVRARRSLPLGMSPARFLHDYWQKRPLLIRGAFPDFTPSLSPDELAGLACMDGALARIVIHRSGQSPQSSRPGNGRDPVPGTATRAGTGQDPPPGPPAYAADGRNPARAKTESALRRNEGKPGRGPRRNGHDWQVLTGPFDEAAFAHLPDSDWTLLVQDVDKWDADTATLLASFAFIPSWRIDDVMISYATDGGGVGAHVDQYDVFLLQGLGIRHWAIDTRPDPPTAFRDDVELKLLRRFRATHAWTLAPGDMLYLPPGVPHDGVAVGECMTFSIGMRAPAAAELLLDFSAQLAEALPETRRYADPDLAPAGDAGEIDDAALARARRTLGGVAAGLADEAFADWFGSFATRYRMARAPMPRRRPCDRAALTARLGRSTVLRDPWSRIAWRRRGRGARLYVAGDVFDAPLAWARELARSARDLDGAQLAKLPQRARGVALLGELVDAGHVRLRRRWSRGD